MKSIIIVFAALLMIIATPAFFQHVDDVITDEETQNYASITTAANVTSANVTLPRGIYNDDTQAIIDITSNITGDSPSAYSFNEVSKILTVGGLIESGSRTLSVDFYIDTVSLDAGLLIWWTVLRWLWVLIITALIGGSIYAFFD